MVSITPVSDDETSISNIDESELEPRKQQQQRQIAQSTSISASTSATSISNFQSLDRPITTSLIRKRSEHNQNLISNLEELSLHQEELTSIGSTIGKICGKTLKILLLQNNVIAKLDGKREMKYFKVLEYLNLALNNITTLCNHNTKGTKFHDSYSHKDDSDCVCNYALNGVWNECLEKIDLTLNFIDFDTLKESLDCLATLPTLRELFMMGNPCCLPSKDSSESDENSSRCSKDEQPTPVWINFRYYVILKLPFLEYLDGQQITRSNRIKAMQMKSQLEAELEYHVRQCQSKKQRIQKQQLHQQKQFQQGKDEEEMTFHCPEQRLLMSHEMAQQKAEKEQNEKANQPKIKTEQDYEDDQRQTIDKVRQLESERQSVSKCDGSQGTTGTNDANGFGNKIKQCNGE
jgi:protein TilB